MVHGILKALPKILSMKISTPIHYPDIIQSDVTQSMIKTRSRNITTEVL
jgi:hypothetical protein